MASCLQLKLWLYDIFKWVSEAEIFFFRPEAPLSYIYILHLHLHITLTFYIYIFLHWLI